MVNTLHTTVGPESSGLMPRTCSPVLVGRADELVALAETARRPPSIALVEGEAGVGKTRLIEELLAGPAIGPRRVLLGHCQQLREPFPYGAVVAALGKCDKAALAGFRLNPVIGALRSHLPEIADALPAQPEPLGDAGAERHRLFRAARELLATLGSVLLVIEDLHWADEGSRALLRFLISDPPRNLSLLVSYRREEAVGGAPLGETHRAPSDTVVTTVELRPLDVDDVRVLVSELLAGQRPVSAEFATKLHERTAGIPLVIEEVLRGQYAQATSMGADREARLPGCVRVPSALRDAMLERLAGLSESAGLLARAAAVLATPCSLKLLAEVAGLDIAHARPAMLEALNRIVLLETADGRYGFRHSLARQAVYRTLPGPVREQLHARAVRELARTEPPPLLRLADHSRAAGEPDDWLRYAEAAADRAVDVGDAATAMAALRPVLEDGAATSTQLDRLASKLSRVASTGLGQYEVTAALQRLLTDDRLSVAVRGQVRLSLGMMLGRQVGSLADSKLEVRLAIDELCGAPELQFKAMSVLAQPFVGMTPVTENRYWIDKVDASVTDFAEPQATDLLANTISARLLIGDSGAWSMIDRLPERVVQPAAQRSLARAHCNLADACSWIGYYEIANGFMRSGTRLAVDSGGSYIASTARSTHAHLDWLTGQWTGLVERAQQLREDYHDLHPVASELSLVLGCLAVANGEWEAATGYLWNTGAQDPDNAYAPVAIAAHAAIIRMLNSQEDYASAAATADSGLDLLRTKRAWAWAGELVPAAVDAYCAHGRYVDAVSLTDELDDAASTLDAPAVDAAVAMCRGAIAAEKGEDRAALEHLEMAAELTRRLPAPYFAARAAERAAEYRLRRGLPGWERLAAIADEFDALGAAGDSARCRHLLRAHGVRQPSRRGRRGYGDELSPRERDVHRLLVDGRTNQEIADALYLSRRTVEHHVAKTLRKLNAESRTDLQRR